MWVLGLYLTGAAALGYVVSPFRDLVARRGRPKAKPLCEAETAR